ncbi:MAG: gluconeogenesis factor YvcK family protein, partial [Candidatus Dormibacteraceae bacterium]
MIERRRQIALRWLLWLAPGLEIKRWLLLLGAGILVLELGAAYLLKDFYLQVNGLPRQFYWITLQFLSRGTRALTFGIVGVGLVVYAFYKLQRSVLGPFIPGASQRGMANLLYTYRSRNRGPRLAVVGGGTGMSTLLRGLKEHSSNLAAIVTVADDGGSSGRLRAEYRILPPGDIRQCLVALADAEPLVKDLL